MSHAAPLTNCRVVLVRPEVAGNIGATARAMTNFGLRQLVLVSPKADPAGREARRISTHGEEILEGARVVSDFADAVGDCVFVAGTSARIGGLYREQGVGSPSDIMPRVIASLQHGPAGLVFGPEPSGLTNEEVSRCHALIHIPADPAYSALNLAQAVTVCLYELRRQWLSMEVASGSASPAPFAEQDRMFDHLRRGLEAVHFLYGEKADSLMHAVRHLIGRAGPTPTEIGVLHGLARQLEWIAGQAGQENELPPSGHSA
ncbi:MAG TPA: RNA methyltransferase [Gemmataceae bacterium]|nr:RNA methyltransferase [Gemmataceae bacterium]